MDFNLEQFITDSNYEEILKCEPLKPNFLNEFELIAKYEYYWNCQEGNINSGDEIIYEITSSEFLDKFGLGDGEIFRFLVEEQVFKIVNGLGLYSPGLDMDLSNYYSSNFPDITIAVVNEAILNKEPLFKKYVVCSPSSHNCCRIIDSKAPLHELPYKTWYITKKEALTIIYNILKKYCDVKQVTLDDFLSKFNLFYD